MGNLSTSISPTRAFVRLSGKRVMSIALEDLRQIPWFEARLQRWGSEDANDPEVDLDCAGVDDPEALLLVPQIHSQRNFSNIPPGKLSPCLALCAFLLIEIPPARFAEYLKGHDLNLRFDDLLTSPLKDGRHPSYLQEAITGFADAAHDELCAQVQQYCLPQLSPLHCPVLRQIFELIAKPPCALLPDARDALDKLSARLYICAPHKVDETLQKLNAQTSRPSSFWTLTDLSREFESHLNSFENYVTDGCTLSLISAIHSQTVSQREFVKAISSLPEVSQPAQSLRLFEMGNVGSRLERLMPRMRRISTTGAALRKLPRASLEDTRTKALALIDDEDWKIEVPPQFPDRCQPPFGFFERDPDVQEFWPMLAKFPWQSYALQVVLGGGAMTHCFTRQGFGDLDFYFVKKKPYTDFSSVWLQNALESCIKHIECNLKTRFVVVKNPHTVSLVTCTHPKVICQFIVTCFNRIDEILMLADMACTQIVFDGVNVHVSPRGLLSLLTGYNNISNTYQTPFRSQVQFPDRLAKYFQRGFGITMQNEPRVVETPSDDSKGRSVADQCTNISQDEMEAGVSGPSEPTGWRRMRLSLERQPLDRPRKVLGGIDAFTEDQILRRSPARLPFNVLDGSSAHDPADHPADHLMAPWLDEHLLTDMEGVPSGAGICGKEHRTNGDAFIFDTSFCADWRYMCIEVGRFYHIFNCIAKNSVDDQDAVFRRMWHTEKRNACRMQRLLCSTGIPVDKVQRVLLQCRWRNMDAALELLFDMEENEATQNEVNVHFTPKFIKVFGRHNNGSPNGVCFGVFGQVAAGERLSTTQARLVGELVDEFIAAGLLTRSAAEASVQQIEESLQKLSLDEVPDACASTGNARIGEALLRNCHDKIDVIILEFSRDPKQFHDALSLEDEESIELRQCRLALENNGHDIRPPGGYHIFVRPECYEAVVQHLKLHWPDLRGRHIVVAKEFEFAVKDITNRLPGKLQVRVKRREVAAVANGASQEPRVTEESDQENTEADIAKEQQHGHHWPLVITRTFIEIPIPRSSSSGPSTGAKTV